MEFPKYFYFKINVIDHGCGVEVEDASDLDVVEVVRCKDCKHAIKDKVLKDRYDCQMLDMYVSPNGYCSDGEVKNE